jgi:hypothetical protein
MTFRSESIKQFYKTEVWDISVLLAGKKLNVMKRDGRTDGGTK